jgi:hypothetical protein
LGWWQDLSSRDIIQYLGEEIVRGLEELALALGPLLLATTARRSLHRLALSTLADVLLVELTPEAVTIIGDENAPRRKERLINHGLVLGTCRGKQLAIFLPLVALRPLWTGLGLRSLTLFSIGSTFTPEEFRIAFADLIHLATVEVAQPSCQVLLSALSPSPDVLPALSQLCIRRMKSTEQEWLQNVIQLVNTFGTSNRPRPRLHILRLDQLTHASVSAEDIAQLQDYAERVLLRGSSV